MFSLRVSAFRIRFPNFTFYTKCRRFNGSVSSFKKDKIKEKKGSGSGYDQYQQRLKYVQECKLNGINLYPHKFKVSHSLYEINNVFDFIDKEQEDDTTVNVTGRIFARRDASKNLKFLDIVDNGAKLQIVMNSKHYSNKDVFNEVAQRINRGDIIGIEGKPFRTKAGELSIRAKSITVLAPCLHSLPTSTSLASKSIEFYRRSRYLDLLTNDSCRNRFMLRSKIVSFIRKFLTNLDFMEVETPILNSVPGGAAALPFETHHNALSQDLFLRVAPELYLKMLIIGGFNKVFEIGRQFRNESIDNSHLPEFTSCEFYSAHEDYNDTRILTENLFSSLVFEIFNCYQFTYSAGASELNLNFQPPFRKIRFMDSIESSLNVKLPAPDTLHTDQARTELFDICSGNHIKVDNSSSTSKLLDKLFESAVQPTCEQPTFVLDHPKIMSPLAKEHPETEGLTERFELFVAGKEICNAYSELNDPAEQRLRFQQDKINATDSEYHVADENFCTALEHGLPPTAGWGLGLDRLVMLLTNCRSISDVILFPPMKPDNIGKYRLKTTSDN